MTTTVETTASGRPPTTDALATTLAPVEAPKTRYYLIDGLRGVAALLVVLHHFYNETAGSIRDAVAVILPRPIEWVIERGTAGVDIFFIISGFVIALSVGRSRVTPRYFANFALRRSLRLDPPYWTAILLSLAIAVVGDKVMKRPIVLPTWDGLLANMTYLQNILRYPRLVFVSWTLVHEIQFYLLFIGLLALAQRASPGSGRGGDPAPLWWFACFGATGLASLFWPSTGLRFQQAWCVNTWYLFSAGVFCYLLFSKKIGPWLALAYLGPVCVVLLSNPNPHSVTAVLTLALLLVASRAGGMEGWLTAAPLQYLGRISYSLYLIHWPIGNRLLNLGAKYQHGSTLRGVAMFVGACAISILAAEALHRLVEAPSMRLARRLKPRPSTGERRPWRLPWRAQAFGWWT